MGLGNFFGRTSVELTLSNSQNSTDRMPLVSLQESYTYQVIGKKVRVYPNRFNETLPYRRSKARFQRSVTGWGHNVQLLAANRFRIRGGVHQCRLHLPISHI